MLEHGRIAIAGERSTAQPLSEAEAEAHLRSVARVLLLRGTALRELEAKSVTAADLKGPTGKIRAPLVVVGDTLLAGFRLEALAALLAGDRPSSATIQSATPSARSRKAKSKAESRRRS